jgi:hypothetical protein
MTFLQGEGLMIPMVGIVMLLFVGGTLGRSASWSDWFGRKNKEEKRTIVLNLLKTVERNFDVVQEKAWKDCLFKSREKHRLVNEHLDLALKQLKECVNKANKEISEPLQKLARANCFGVLNMSGVDDLAEKQREEIKREEVSCSQEAYEACKQQAHDLDELSDRLLEAYEMDKIFKPHFYCVDPKPKFNSEQTFHNFEQVFPDQGGRADALRTLGLDPASNPTRESVRKAYRDLAAKWHPDVCTQHQNPKTTKNYTPQECAQNLMSLQDAKERLEAQFKLSDD